MGMPTRNIHILSSSCISTVPEVITCTEQLDIFASMRLCPLYRSILYIIEFYQENEGQEVCSGWLILFSSHLFIKLLGSGRWVSLAFSLINNVSARACDYTNGLTCCRFCSALWLSMPSLSLWLIGLDQTTAEYQERLECPLNYYCYVTVVHAWEQALRLFGKCFFFFFFYVSCRTHYNATGRNGQFCPVWPMRKPWWPSTWIAIQALGRAAMCGDVSLQRSHPQLTLCDAREHKTNTSEAGVWVSERWVMECAACCFITPKSRTWAKLQAIHLSQTVPY